MEFWDLYRAYADKIYTYLFWCLGNKEEAEDVTGTILIKAQKAYPTLRDKSRTRAWLWAIARNTLKNTIRDRKHHVSLDDLPNQITHDSSATAQHHLLRLRQSLQCLAPEERELLLLREYQGFSYAELAELLDVSIPSIKSRLYRARENLRQQFFGQEVPHAMSGGS